MTVWVDGEEVPGFTLGEVFDALAAEASAMWDGEDHVIFFDFTDQDSDGEAWGTWR